VPEQLRTKQKKEKEPEQFDFSQSIRAYRENFGLTLRAFAVRAGISLTAAFQAEHGRNISIRNRARLRALLNGKSDA
jgi:hypothetical protein